LIGRELRGAEATAADEQSANFRERRGAESRCGCGRGGPSLGADVGPGPAQMRKRPVLAQMWRG
jgi:hypothetical protein